MSPRWDDTREVDKYLRERAVHAKKVLESGENLSRGLTCLLDLKEMGYENVNHARALLKERIPFRVDSCNKQAMCCGSCVRRCRSRCVQDTLHKLYMSAIHVYMGHVKYEDASLLSQMAFKELTNPHTTYETLLDIVNYGYTRGLNPEEDWRGSVEDSDILRYMYAPIPEIWYTKKGRIVKDCDPETGKYKFIEWPDSGLCPYCMPRYLYRRIDKRKPPQRKSY